MSTPSSWLLGATFLCQTAFYLPQRAVRASQGNVGTHLGAAKPPRRFLIHAPASGHRASSHFGVCSKNRKQPADGFHSDSALQRGRGVGPFILSFDNGYGTVTVQAVLGAENRAAGKGGPLPS